MKRLPAFTIMEMIVAMLLTALVIGVAYSVFTIFRSSYNVYAQKNEQLAVSVRLDVLLRRDIDRATRVFRTDSGILLENEHQLISYEFNPSYVVRHQPMTDTFKIANQQLQLWFENRPVSFLSADTQRNMVDEIRLRVLLEKQWVFFHYRKSYSSVDLNANYHASH